MAAAPKNDRKSAVTKFCLEMETHRRSAEGRVRSAREMLDVFFPRSGPGGAVDRIFFHMPKEVRGPIIAGWGIRGAKSALRDDDERVRRVVEDALASGDIDENAFETGLAPEVFIDWIPLKDWWAFWRSGKLTGLAIQKALAAARDLALFDDRWFLENVDGRGGKLKGTDTICDTLSKDQIVGWLKATHFSGDATPAGLVVALGWDVILAKTAQDALLFALDAFARKVGLAPPLGAEKGGSPSGNPGDWEPPSTPSYDSLYSTTGATAAALSEARAAMMTSIEQEKAPPRK
ncbi:MAG: hypothetical protein JST00_18455 [Deltaproteobacteria bacterium]|nr:hypothetical protein [Deltaproteobacteria bacterium]